MESRRLIRFGKNSHVVSLPKGWLESNGLQKGDELFLDEKAGSIVILARNSREEPKVARIAYETEDLLLLQTELTGYYKAGCDTIIIEGSGLKRDAETVKDLIRGLAGIEIVEQSLTRIVMKDLIDIKQIALPTLVRRMDMMLRSLFQDVLDEQDVPNKLIRDRDKDINRLQFLVTRVIRKLFRNPALGNVIGVKTDEAYYTDKVAWSLERIGDCIKRADDDLLRCSKEVRKELRAHIRKMHEYYLTTIKAYEKHESKRALQLHGELQDLRERYTDKVRGARSHDEVLALENIKTICRELRVISRAVVEMSQDQAIEGQP